MILDFYQDVFNVDNLIILSKKVKYNLRTNVCSTFVFFTIPVTFWKIAPKHF